MSTAGLPGDRRHRRDDAGAVVAEVEERGRERVAVGGDERLVEGRARRQRQLGPQVRLGYAVEAGQADRPDLDLRPFVDDQPDVDEAAAAGLRRLGRVRVALLHHQLDADVAIAGAPVALAQRRGLAVDGALDEDVARRRLQHRGDLGGGQRPDAFHVDAADPEDLAGGDREGHGEAARRGVAAIADFRLPVALLVEELLDPAQRVLEQVLVDGRLARHRHQLGAPRLGDRIAFEAQRDERSGHDRDGDVDQRIAGRGRAGRRRPDERRRLVVTIAPQPGAHGVELPFDVRPVVDLAGLDVELAADARRQALGVDRHPADAGAAAGGDVEAHRGAAARVRLDRGRDAGLDEAARRELRRQHLRGRLRAAGRRLRAEAIDHDPAQLAGVEAEIAAERQPADGLGRRQPVGHADAAGVADRRDRRVDRLEHPGVEEVQQRRPQVDERELRAGRRLDQRHPARLDGRLAGNRDGDFEHRVAGPIRGIEGFAVLPRAGPRAAAPGWAAGWARRRARASAANIPTTAACQRCCLSRRRLTRTRASCARRSRRSRPRCATGSTRSDRSGCTR